MLSKSTVPFAVIDPDPGRALGDDHERSAVGRSPADRAPPSAPSASTAAATSAAGTSMPARDLGLDRRRRRRRRAARAGRSCRDRARRSGRRAAPGSAPRAPAGGRGRRARSPRPGSRARSAPAPRAPALGRRRAGRPRRPRAAGPRPARTAPAGCSAAPSSRRSRARRAGRRAPAPSRSPRAGPPACPTACEPARAGSRAGSRPASAAAARAPAALSCAWPPPCRTKPLSWQKRWKTSSGSSRQVARIGAHVAGDEARVGEHLGLGVLDRRDVGRLDPEVALDVEQGLAERGPLAAQLVAEGELVGAVATRPWVVAALLMDPPGDPLLSPARVSLPPNQLRRISVFCGIVSCF